jgi:hypothetical protein
LQVAGNPRNDQPKPAEFTKPVGSLQSRPALD